MEVADLVAKIIRDDKPVKVNIDVGGLGVGVADRLDEQGYGEIINRVNFGGSLLSRRGKPLRRRQSCASDRRRALGIPRDIAAGARTPAASARRHFSDNLILRTQRLLGRFPGARSLRHPR